VERYLELGVRAAQATLGVPMYGRVFQLLNSSADTSLGAPTTKLAGKPGPASQAEGLLQYNEVNCQLSCQCWNSL
jgi:GH18 family chitinase